MSRVKVHVVLIFLFCFSICYAGVEAEVKDHYLETDDNIDADVVIDEPYSGTADLKFCLAEYDFEELNFNYRCDIFLERHNISFSNYYEESYSFELENIEPYMYRLFVQLHYDDKYRKDSDKDNLVYVVGEKYKESSDRQSEIVMKVLETPYTGRQGGIITSEINLSVYKNDSIIKVSECITGGWTSNKKEFSIPYGSSKTIHLENIIEEDAPPGEYTYKIRVNTGAKYDYTNKIIIYPYINPDIKVELINNSLKIKNIDSKKANYTVRMDFENNTRIINDSINPHTLKQIRLNNTTQLISVYLNNELHYKKLLIRKNIITRMVNNTIIETRIINDSSKITGNIVAEDDSSENLHVFSILIGLGLLTTVYIKMNRNSFI